MLRQLCLGVRPTFTEDILTTDLNETGGPQFQSRSCTGYDGSLSKADCNRVRTRSTRDAQEHSKVTSAPRSTVRVQRVGTNIFLSPLLSFVFFSSSFLLPTNFGVSSSRGELEEKRDKNPSSTSLVGRDLLPPESHGPVCRRRFRGALTKVGLTTV